MAERIVSPGVFTNEIDVSFLPSAVSDIGAALIGITTKGPAFTPTIVDSFSDFKVKFGGLNPDYFLPYASRSYLKNAGSCTIVRVLGTTGYTATNALSIKDYTSGKVYAVVFPTASAGNLTGTKLMSGVSGSTSFAIDWHGTGTDLSPTMSLNTGADNYIENILGTGAKGATQVGYLYTIFKHSANGASGALATGSTTTAVTNSTAFTSGYSYAYTPKILSQTGSTASDKTELFRFETLSHGKYSNREVKVGIANIKKAGSIAGSDYGSFDVIIRNFDDTDKRPEAVETFAGCNLDADSPNYIAKKIGDIEWKFNTTKGKLEILNGDFNNKSKYVRVGLIHDSVKNKTAGVNLVPWGFGSYKYPVNISGSSVDIPIRLNQSESGDYNSKLYHGLAFDSGSTSANGYAKDILPYLNPVPDAIVANMTSSEFRLDQSSDVTSSLDSTLATKKFILGFQGGDDGFDPTYLGGPNSDGTVYGLGNANPSNSGNDLTAYKNAISTISNPDETDINMLVLPGINSSDHPKVHVKARDVIEDRADTFYVFDAGNYNASISDWTSTVETEDTNYSSTYYPWVKINDDENNKHVWVPPSVVIPGVIAFTDKVAHPWFAPAGLNRGGLTEVIMAKERLTHAERDTLYEERVNPIATFPGEGVVVWGQKTLQGKPSALDRVNVRRLLIKIKKFIAASSRFLVFEQNTNATRQRFLNIVNPFLETVQSNSGVSAFRVVMDDTNNTPDVVDRNELRGQIFVQPTRTAEYIVLDFVVQPTGAAFED
jgi:hypothetical protein